MITSTRSKLYLSDAELDWTFNGEDTRDFTHCYHDYPARMIPQIARQFLEIFTKNSKGKLLDPYCGTGTTLFEGFIKGFDVVGFDLNPLALLIAKAKTTVFDLPEIDLYISKFGKFISSEPILSEMPEIVGISRLDFWFKPEVTEKLAIVKSFIDDIPIAEIKPFFLTAFSETVREASNTRTHEFKLYRYNDEVLAKFQPDVFGLMSAKLQRNRRGLVDFLGLLKNVPRNPASDIFEFNTVEKSPDELEGIVDVVLTSPPYGDSTTTVAYGQYSRLSAAWLGLNEPEKTDGKLMGSKRRKSVENFECDLLDTAILKISEIDEKRAIEVSGFYSDLRKSIKHVAHTIKHNGLACYVVGNRRVKSVTLPTDLAVKSFFEQNNFKYLNTFYRTIPNKRMPLRNSPSNVAGTTENTMNREAIVILKKL